MMKDFSAVGRTFDRLKMTGGWCQFVGALGRLPGADPSTGSG
jgi:hypothetical protein